MGDLHRKVSGAVRVCLGLSGWAAASHAAHAGAWSPAQGDGQMIASLAREDGDFGVTWRADDYLEYGFGGGWAANLKLENQLRSADGYDDRFGGRIGLQRSFPIGESAVIGVQAALLAGDALEGPACAGVGYEARVMAGVSLPSGGRNAFINVEAGQRERDGGCSRTLAEVSAGLDLAPRWRTIGKLWSEQGGGARSAKAEVTLLRDFGSLSVGLGYRGEVSGEFEETGVVAVLWSRF